MRFKAGEVGWTEAGQHEGEKLTGKPIEAILIEANQRVALSIPIRPHTQGVVVMNHRGIAAITGTVLIAALLVIGVFKWLGAEEEAALL